jgi:hypothetical protein
MAISLSSASLWQWVAALVLVALGGFAYVHLQKLVIQRLVNSTSNKRKPKKKRYTHNGPKRMIWSYLVVKRKRVT